MIPSISSKLDAEQNKELSSANNLVKLNNEDEISFTKIKNRRGHKTEPLGTPAFTFLNYDVHDFMTTLCLLSENYLFYQW